MVQLNLRPNQKEIFNFILDKEYSLIVHWMRSGKTLPVCMAIKQWNTTTLIACPPAAIPVWEAHLKEVGLEHGNGIIEILSTGQLQKGDIGLKKKDIASYGFKVVIIDEIHQFKTYSNRFRNLRKFTDYAKITIGMSATPFESDQEDLFYEMQLLDKGQMFGTNKAIFQETYCDVKNPFSDYPEFEFKKELLPELNDYLREFTTVFKTDKISEPKQFSIVYHLTNEQKKAITNITDKRPFPEVEDNTLYWSPGVQHSKVKQAFMGFLYYGELSSEQKIFLFEKKSPVWNAVKGILQAFKGKQILVWRNFTEETRMFMDMVKEHNLGRVAEFSKRNYTQFKKGKLDYLVCHPKSAGQGIDFSFCDHAIYLSLPDSMIDYLQSLYRLSKYNDKEEKFIWFMIPWHPLGDKTFLSLRKKVKKLEQFYENGNT